MGEPPRVSNALSAKRLDVSLQGAKRSNDEPIREEGRGSQCATDYQMAMVAYLISSIKGKDIMRKVHVLLGLGLTLLSAGAFVVGDNYLGRLTTTMLAG